MDSRNVRTVSMGDFRPPNINPRVVGTIIALLLGAALLFSMFFTVAPEEVGIVLTFGAYSPPDRPSGLNWKLPWPVQTVMKVPVQRQLKQEFGFRTRTAGIKSKFTTAGLEGE